MTSKKLPRFDLPGWTLNAMRRLLYRWIRTHVFPEQLAMLNVRTDVPIIYVLHEQHLSNLLVLDHECRQMGLPPALKPVQDGGFVARRSFFVLAREPDGADVPNPRRDHSPLLYSMVRQADLNPQFEVQLVPVTILWGREPGKQDSIVKALFAETWQRVTPLRQIVAILIHGRHTVVRFSAPLSLRQMVNESTAEEGPVKKISQVLALHFHQQREMAIGPDLSHRRTQLRALLATPNVRAAIATEALSKGLPFAQAEKAASTFAHEIASDYSFSLVRAFSLFLEWVWTTVYNGIEIHNFNRVTDLAPGNGIIYVPCHRSHIDYLLLSYIIFNRGMMVPHIAAGANLNMPIVGTILRRAGAFFMRRRIKGEPLYAAVFLEYLHLMIDRGFPIEYFIEGGRSRSGRMLSPKAGILAMTIQSFVSRHSRPLYFVPVYVGYEKLMEGGSYLQELDGKPKKAESLLGLIGAVRVLRKHFGKVHVNFGQPLALEEFLDSQHANWRNEPFDRKAPWMRSAVEETSKVLACSINSAAVVNPINLIALTILSTPKHTADVRLLHRQIEHVQALLAAVPYSDSVVHCTMAPPDIIAHAQRLELLDSKTHPLGDLVLATKYQATLLAYFRNNVLHLLALPALMACLVSHNRVLKRGRAKEAIQGIYGLLRAELFLPWQPEQLDDLIDRTEDALVSRGLILRDTSTNVLRAPPPSSEVSPELRQLGEIIRPTLERQFLTLALLKHHGSGTLTIAKLEESSHLLAQRLAMLYEFNAPEFSEKSQFSNVIRNLIDAEVLRTDEAGLLHFDQRITLPAGQTELLLGADVRASIQRIALTEAPVATEPVDPV
jgi:glycerol-3-phosphate O-acyltransferase